MAFTTLPTLYAGMVLTDEHIVDLEACLSELRPLSAAKSSATSRNTTTSRAADPDLTIALPASTTWDLEIIMILSSAANAAGDFSYEIAWTGTASVTAGGLGLDAALPSLTSADLNAGTAVAADTTSPTPNQDVGCSTSVTTSVCFVRVVATTAVTVTLNWAQASSNANNTTLGIGSRIIARRAS